jgi:nitrite reductase/ring-hydroxylating ferredoxin subunit
LVFTRLASVDDLKPNEMKGIKINGNQILLVNLNGAYYAIGNVCTHMGCMLSNGRLVGETVVCSCHASTFDVKTGKVIKGLAFKPEPSYELKIENGQVLVNI